jgi:hypothetical protein
VSLKVEEGSGRVSGRWRRKCVIEAEFRVIRLLTLKMEAEHNPRNVSIAEELEKVRTWILPYALQGGTQLC